MKDHLHASANVHTHEKSDASPRTILVAMSGLVMGAVVVWLCVAALWHFLSKSEEHPSATPFTYGAPRELPPDPKLQVTPYLDWDRYRQEQMRQLNGFGWVDQGAGKVHIPIDRAMDIVAKQGLPSRPAPAPAPMRTKEANEPSAR